MNFKRWFPMAGLAAAALLIGQPALAHGVSKPMHGGIVQVANDLSFELVADKDGVTIHLMDHGKPLAAKGISGKLTVLQGGRKTEADIQEAGDNRLRATGLKVGPGDKLVAVLSNVAGKTTTVRFALK